MTTGAGRAGPRVLGILRLASRRAVVALIVVYFMLPLYWTVLASFRDEAENLRTPVGFWVSDPTLANYTSILGNDRFMRSIVSSLLIAGGATLTSLLIGSLAAYALSRLRMRFKRPLLFFFLGMTTFPSIALLTGLYSLNDRVRAFDAAVPWISIPTETVLVAIYVTFALPLAVWLLSDLFSGIPAPLFEAARVDGASHRQIYLRVLMPLAVPSLVSAGLLIFITAWQEYLYAVTLTTFDADLSTVPVAVTQYAGLGNPIGRIMAAIVVCSVPLVILTVIFQRRIVAGLIIGGVKE